ncbi:hypothetical protein [Amycolatopsis anabasis]|uniref:hypothetical protein n=1 Tax=Amycolatopsis anabasis TaxID=1840409 RepID=UPI00131E75C9|nr:hypothetical protein [Amycolatopsis anabasis]
MKLYSYTAQAPSPAGTKPTFTITGACALDLLRYVTKDTGEEYEHIHDEHGRQVEMDEIIAESRALATTPESRHHWAHHMAHAVLAQLPPADPDSGMRVTTEDDWLDAGRWWARHVGVVPNAEVLSHLGYEVQDYDDEPLYSAIWIFLEAAITRPVEGDSITNRTGSASATRPG